MAAVLTPPAANGSGSPRSSDWQPPRAVATPAVFPDRFEVLVFRQFGGRQLVAAIELIGPGNKDAPDTRTAFAAKVASDLYEEVSVRIVDVVTGRRANPHNEIAGLTRLPDDLLMPPAGLSRPAGFSGITGRV